MLQIVPHWLSFSCCRLCATIRLRCRRPSQSARILPIGGRGEESGMMRRSEPVFELPRKVYRGKFEPPHLNSGRTFQKPNAKQFGFSPTMTRTRLSESTKQPAKIPERQPREQGATGRNAGSIVLAGSGIARSMDSAAREQLAARRTRCASAAVRERRG